MIRGGQLEEGKEGKPVEEDEGGQLGDIKYEEGERRPEIKNRQGRSVWGSDLYREAPQRGNTWRPVGEERLEKKRMDVGTGRANRRTH